MEEFRLRSIDEFNEDFVRELQAEIAARPQYQSAETTASTMVPEVITEETQQEDIQQPIGDVYTPEAITEADTPAFGEEYIPSGKKELSKGAKALKIISIVMLVANIVVFLIGCFVSVFIDNKGFAIAGRTFNTMADDIELSNTEGQKTALAKGDMVIGKKYAVYEPGMYVIVSASNESGCKIVKVNETTGEGANAYINTSDPTSAFGERKDYSADQVYGNITTYMPKFGSIIHYAIDNAILFIILFTLIAAFWFAGIIFVEKVCAKKSLEEEAEMPTGIEAVYGDAPAQQAEENPEEIKFDF